MARQTFVLGSALWLVASCASGCALVRYVAPTTEARLTYVRGTATPPVVPAPLPGLYTLYVEDSPDPARSAEPPQPTVLDKGVVLAKGDLYGFARKPDGSVVAVAKDREIAIGSKAADTYYWKLQKGEGGGDR